MTKNKGKSAKIKMDIEVGDKNPAKGRAPLSKRSKKIKKTKFKPSTKKTKSKPGRVELANYVGNEKLIHSFFDMTHGYYRGLVEAWTQTALAEMTSSYEITIPAGMYYLAAFCPMTVNTVNWYVYSLGSNVVQSPYLATNGATVTTIASPFLALNGGSTPAQNYRCMGCEMIVTPTSAPLNMSASYLFAYKPTLYNSTPNAGNLSVNGNASGNAGWTEANINPLNVQLRGNGLEAVILNAFPNEDEKSFTSSVYANGGGYLKYIKNTGSQAISYTIRIRYIVEYEPLPGILQLVQTARPTIPTTSYEAFTQFVSDYWDMFALCRFDDYKKNLLLLNRASNADYKYVGKNSTLPAPNMNDINPANLRPGDIGINDQAELGYLQLAQVLARNQARHAREAYQVIDALRARVVRPPPIDTTRESFRGGLAENALHQRVLDKDPTVTPMSYILNAYGQGRGLYGQHEHKTFTNMPLTSTSWYHDPLRFDYMV